MNNDRELGIRCDSSLTSRMESELEGNNNNSSIRMRDGKGNTCNLMPPAASAAAAASSSSFTDQESDQQYEINRRSRSNSIAAGAIARLKNLPQIRLSLPPEDLVPPTSAAGNLSASPPSAGSMNHSLLLHDSSSPDSAGSGSNSHIFDHLPLHHPLHPRNRLLQAGATSNNCMQVQQPNDSLLYQRRSGVGEATSKKKKKKVLDQKDLNLKPESNQSLRRNSLPINDQLLAASSIQIKFLSETAGRRLSQVSSVVTAQIQSRIGWRSLISEEEVVDQGKCLAAKFVWIKLRKSGFCHKRFHLQRLRSVCNFSENEDVDRTLNQVAAELRALSHQLESAHPKIFTSVLNQVGPNCFKSVSSVTKTQILVGQFLFSCQEISWTHVAAFFTITAALALDSVISGHHDFVMPLIDSFADFANGDLAHWVAQEGGWVRA